MDDAEREKLMGLIDEWKAECASARKERDEARAKAAEYVQNKKENDNGT